MPRFNFSGFRKHGIIQDLIVNDTPDLFFNETDGSSFPNGDMRQTHRAAAFMNWDRVSPPFVRNGCLYLPAVTTDQVVTRVSPVIHPATSVAPVLPVT